MGDYRKPLLTLWSTNDYTSLLNWQDESSSSYINCLAWNPMRANEFCLGGSMVLFVFVQLLNKQMIQIYDYKLLIDKFHHQLLNIQKRSCEITSCVYLISNTKSCSLFN